MAESKTYLFCYLIVSIYKNNSSVMYTDNAESVEQLTGGRVLRNAASP